MYGYIHCLHVCICIIVYTCIHIALAAGGCFGKSAHPMFGKSSFPFRYSASTTMPGYVQHTCRCILLCMLHLCLRPYPHLQPTSTYMYVRLSLYLPTYLSICLSIYQFLYICSHISRGIYTPMSGHQHWRQLRDVIRDGMRMVQGGGKQRRITADQKQLADERAAQVMETAGSLPYNDALLLVSRHTRMSVAELVHEWSFEVDWQQEWGSRTQHVRGSTASSSSGRERRD